MALLWNPYFWPLTQSYFGRIANWMILRSQRGRISSLILVNFHDFGVIIADLRCFYSTSRVLWFAVSTVEGENYRVFDDTCWWQRPHFWCIHLRDPNFLSSLLHLLSWGIGPNSHQIPANMLALWELGLTGQVFVGLSCLAFGLEAALVLFHFIGIIYA